MLIDPRVYSTYSGSNILLNLAQQVIENKLPVGELDCIMRTTLQQGNDTLVNLAINLAPNVEICQLLWHTIDRAIHSEPGDLVANLFAIPIILVVGSKEKQAIPGHIDVKRLNQFVRDKELFEGDCRLSGTLATLQSISILKPSKLYQLVRAVHSTKIDLIEGMTESPIVAFNTGVLARVLLGVCINCQSEFESPQVQATNAFNVGKYNNASLEFMQLITQELCVDGITLCPIPFAPVSLFKSSIVGEVYHNEIAFQVTVSNIVRNIRQQGHIPCASIATSDSTILVKIGSSRQPTLTETATWQLSLYDDFTAISSKIISLLQDMQVEICYL